MATDLCTPTITETADLWSVPPSRDDRALTSELPIARLPLTVDSIKSARIMLVDDEPVIINAIRKYLQDAGFERFTTITEPLETFESIKRERPDVVLLDLMMPGTTGLQILKMVRSEPLTMHIPVMILTAASDMLTKLEALNLGATDFLSKPVEGCELVARVTNTLFAKLHRDQLSAYSVQLEQEVRRRTMELDHTRQEVIHCLARAAECHDDATGFHIARVGKYAASIAQRLGWSASAVDSMGQAAKLHDVGKIGVRDSILHKPAKLIVEEFDLMKRHCEIGRNIIQQQPRNYRVGASLQTAETANGVSSQLSPVMALAAEIAYTHHEKWDGSGYPQGLRGTEIPLSGRIVAVADVFDALCSRRSYKPKFLLDESLLLIDQGRGSHFDPQVVDAFFAGLDDVIRIHRDFAGQDAAEYPTLPASESDAGSVGYVAGPR